LKDMFWEGRGFKPRRKTGKHPAALAAEGDLD
jgi:hypothetical protein